MSIYRVLEQHLTEPETRLQRSSEYQNLRVTVISSFGTPGTREYQSFHLLVLQELASTQSFQLLVLQVLATM